VGLVAASTDGSTYITSVELYRPGASAWQAAPDLPTGRAFLAAAPALDGKLWAIGGAGTEMLVEELSPFVDTAW